MFLQEIKSITSKFNIDKFQYFPETETLFIDTGLDFWKITYHPRRERKYNLYHQNKFGSRNIFHLQGIKTELYHAIHSIFTHKNVLMIVKPSFTHQAFSQFQTIN